MADSAQDRLVDDTGMGRFFSPENIDRYRVLASGVAGKVERDRVFEALAQEMRAFRRACHEWPIIG